MDKMAERDVVIISNHRAWIEEPYALVFEADGDVTGEHMTKMLDMLDIIGGGEGPVIILQDLSKCGAFTGAARKAIMEDPRTNRVTAVICINASFQMRVILTMIAKTIGVISSRASRTKLAKDQAEGRALLAAERERLQKKQG
jgi:hypothetical protein